MKQAIATSAITRRSHSFPRARDYSAKLQMKRQRNAEPNGDADVPPYALISCFDEVDRMIEVNTGLLRPFNCRLYKMIKHDRPYTSDQGKNFWKVNMTRSMLQTFIRSLEHGELSLGKNVSVNEALTTFEFENVNVGVSASQMGMAGSSKWVQPARPGAVFEKRSERLNQIIHQTSEQCAHAISIWPRLESCLDAAIEGVPVNTTCTATRIWVNLCRKPLSSTDKNVATMHLANKWPLWLKTTLVSYGLLHAKLVRDKVVTNTARDENAFNALFTAVQGDILGWLSSTRYDYTKISIDKNLRKEISTAESFACEMKAAILENDTKNTESKQRLDYARGCFSMAETQLQESPNPSTIFSGVCSDDSGKSPERAQFAKSLGQRGIKVVKWALDYSLPKHPLMFPPAWKESGVSGCCVLLDFSDRR